MLPVLYKARNLSHRMGLDMQSLYFIQESSSQVMVRGPSQVYIGTCTSPAWPIPASQDLNSIAPLSRPSPDSKIISVDKSAGEEAPARHRAKARELRYPHSLWTN